MSLIAWLVIASMVVEIAVFLSHGLWVIRKPLAFILVALIAFSAGGLLFWRPNIFTSLFFVAGLFRLFNILRVAEGRINEKNLYYSSKRTAFSLIGWQLAILLIWLAVHELHMGVVNIHSWTIGLIWLLTVGCFILALSTLRNLRKTRPVRSTKHLTDHELPTVSVCVPARNETSDLEELLQTLIASDYPKLEILVLDDCSANKHTSDIIRGFAHDGVRFIQGTEPPEHWLAKNWAYEQLIKEASGELVLFCGVDIRFTSDSIRALVSILTERDKLMLSVVPEVPHQTNLSLIQPMRYWWELAPPRRQFSKPPVLSSCWLAKRKSIKKAGGMKAVSQSIVPEAFFARNFIADDGYSFIRSTSVLGVSSYKSSSEQRSTAIRTRYPQLHRRPELVMAFGLLEAAFLLLPFILLISSIWLNLDSAEVVPCAIASLLLIFSYEALVVTVIPRTALLSIVTFPFAVVIDICLMFFSMSKYELSTVEWKGRNVCLPVMHTTPDIT